MRLEVLLVVVALSGYVWGWREVSDAQPQGSPSCSRHVERSDGTILDIKKSVHLGAELLLGTWSEDQESCLSRCCHKASCDMALYKTDGVSMKGNNCYLVRCGSRENCHMVPLDSFNTFYLPAKTVSKTSDPSHTLDTLTEHNEHGRKGHDRDNSMATTGPNPIFETSTSAVPHTSVGMKAEAATSAMPSETGAPANPTTPDRDDHESPTSSSNKQHSTKSTESVKLSTNSSKTANKQDKGKDSPDSAVKKNKSCGAYGCDGSGIVAVVVVAAICVAIIIVVGAILLKKVVDERRRKKFRNVDYLINGMYT